MKITFLRIIPPRSALLPGDVIESRLELSMSWVQILVQNFVFTFTQILVGTLWIRPIYPSAARHGFNRRTMSDLSPYLTTSIKEGWLWNKNRMWPLNCNQSELSVVTVSTTGSFCWCWRNKNESEKRAMFGIQHTIWSAHLNDKKITMICKVPSNRISYVMKLEWRQYNIEYIIKNRDEEFVNTKQFKYLCV